MKRDYIELRVDSKTVKIPVNAAVKTNFNNQFVRDRPSKLQKQKYETIMALIRAAYKAGQNAS